MIQAASRGVNMEHQAVLYTFRSLPIQLRTHDGGEGGIMGDIRMGWGREGWLKAEVVDRWDGIGYVGERLLAGGIYLPLDTTLLSLQMSHRRSLEDREEKEELK